MPETDKEKAVGSTQTQPATAVSTAPANKPPVPATANVATAKPVESHKVFDSTGKEVKPDFKAVSHPGSVAPNISSDTLAKEREDIHKKMEEILRKYGGLETSIPLTDDYWNLRNQYIARRG